MHELTPPHHGDAMIILAGSYLKTSGFGDDLAVIRSRICERVDMALSETRAALTRSAAFEQASTVPLGGIPPRARVGTAVRVLNVLTGFQSS